MEWTVYHCDPIDVGWNHLEPVKSVADRLPEGDDESKERFIADYWKVMVFAKRHLYWEGGFRKGHEPRVFWMPEPDEYRFAYCFAWKQDNNGSTFLAVPIHLALPWLERCGFKIGGTDELLEVTF